MSKSINTAALASLLAPWFASGEDEDIPTGWEVEGAYEEPHRVPRVHGEVDGNRIYCVDPEDHCPFWLVWGGPGEIPENLFHNDTALEERHEKLLEIGNALGGWRECEGCGECVSVGEVCPHCGQ